MLTRRPTARSALCRASVLAVALAVALAPGSARAFSTRVHIAIANELRLSLIASGDQSIPLALGDHHVRLSAEDAEAIIQHPLAFRAGAVGPDAMFPAMTDPTHAHGMRPFEQCELIYAAAVTPEERAFAMGCFVHGATDAVAHHFVNYLTGETFTLTPLTAGREESWDNVVRHLVAELMIQRAAVDGRPDAFVASELYHAIPAGFVARVYLDASSPIWQILSAPAVAKLDAYVAANPGAQLAEIMGSAGLVAADHATLIPVYVRLLDEELLGLRDTLTNRIAHFQDPATPEGAELRVTAGGDGQLGTPDDETACAATCPGLYGEYVTYVSLVAPRQDGDGDPLPSAFDEVRLDLSQSLHELPSAYIATVANLSTLLNTPNEAGETGLGLSVADIDGAMEPLRAWLAKATTIDYEALMQALLPAWLLRLDQLLQPIGIEVADIVKILFQPVIDEARAAIEDHLLARVREYLAVISAEIEAEQARIEAEFRARLEVGADPGGPGTALDALFDSGLYAHSFNLAAAALAEHDVVLPADQAHGGLGPATFDGSFTPEWTRAAACEHLRPAIFPLGLGVDALLSARRDGDDFMVTSGGDSPIECHDGSLTGFAPAPTPAVCAVTDLASLRQPPHVGSLTRSFPPSAVDSAIDCAGLIVPGLPEPPVRETDAPDADCTSCDAAGGEGGPTTALGVLLLVLVSLRRRRRRRHGQTLAVVVGLVLALAGCGNGGDEIGPDAGDSSDRADAGGDGRAALLEALGSSTWHAMGEQDGVPRAMELEFRASSLLWGQTQNPYGPARERKMRSFSVAPDGRSVTSTVITPNGWPIPRDNGRQEDWTFDISGDAGSRQLRIERDGHVVTYDEGPWPAPDTGLTAIAYAFTAGGAIDDAFCGSGFGGFDYERLLDAARGRGGEQLLGTDVVAGVPLLTWRDESGGNSFAITDVPGFDRLGGTRLTTQFNFIITYFGALEHPGGPLAMREKDDSVEDGVWVFLGDSVGSSSTADLFLEVHGFAWADLTPDEPTVDAAAGQLPFEAIIVRCSEPLEDIDLEIRRGPVPFTLVGELSSTPHIDRELFPSVF